MKLKERDSLVTNNELTKFNTEIKSSTIINYVTGFSENNKSVEHPYFTTTYTNNNSNYDWVNNDTYPIFLSEFKSVTIPKKAKRQIGRLPKKVLQSIDKDKTVAIDKCIILLSNLTSTLFIDNCDGWKSLKAKILNDQVKKGNDNTYTYKKVIKALEYSTNSTNPIIESKKNSLGSDTYVVGEIAKQYRFTSEFQNKNVVKYQLKTQDSINKRRMYLHTKYNEARNNVIGKNLLTLYPSIELPSINEVLIQGKKLAKQKHKTKKGKLLTVQNNKSKEYYKDYDNRSFVEENIKQFNYLTTNGYLVPTVGTYKSGGRVVDSFNLMPSWIRQMCKIDDEDIVEVDYSAFHPNIAMAVYGGTAKYLTHSEVANSLNKEVSMVKIEHLSFFNKHPKDMQRSILFNYYKEKEPRMLEKIINEKIAFNYKKTSKVLFKKEVEIMSLCINELNKKNIYVMYVYDSLYCKFSEVEIVKKVMGQVVIKNNIYTTVK